MRTPRTDGRLPGWDEGFFIRVYAGDGDSLVWLVVLHVHGQQYTLVTCVRDRDTPVPGGSLGLLDHANCQAQQTPRTVTTLSLLEFRGIEYRPCT